MTGKFYFLKFSFHGMSSSKISFEIVWDLKPVMVPFLFFSKIILSIFIVITASTSEVRGDITVDECVNLVKWVDSRDFDLTLEVLRED